jgi:hypothetical protein
VSKIGSYILATQSPIGLQYESPDAVLGSPSSKSFVHMERNGQFKKGLQIDSI